MAYTRDAEGLTPLIRAAQTGRLAICSILMQRYPQSIQLCDLNGRTFLHYLNCRSSVDVVGCGPKIDILELLPGIDHVLRAKKDKDGNTPLHYALIKGDLDLAQVLVAKCLSDESKLELSVVNNEGHSIISLLASLPNTPRHLAMKKKIESSLAIKLRPMEELYIAKEEGRLCSLIDEIANDKEYNPYRTNEGNKNILHLAIEADNSEAVEKALKRFPRLMIQTDSDGNTPLHTAAKTDNAASKTLVRCCKQSFGQMEKNAFLIYDPWKVQNSIGNTPLHEALRANNYTTAIELLKWGFFPVDTINHAGETPLHLCAKYGTYTIDETIEIMDKLMREDSSMVNVRDTDGFTPLMRAAHSGRLQVCAVILKLFPESIELRDLEGKSVLHHFLGFSSSIDIVGHASNDSISNLLEIFPGLDTLRAAQDADGNTPLHYAIKNNDISFATLLVNQCLRKNATFQELYLLDNQGNSVLNLLASKSNSFQHMIMKENIENIIHQQKPMKRDVYESILHRHVNKLYDWDFNLNLLFEEPHDENNEADEDDWNFILNLLFEEPHDENNEDSLEGTNYKWILDRDIPFYRATDGSNILHLAIQHDIPELANMIFRDFPELMLQTTKTNGDNPLHIAAKFINTAGRKVARHLVENWLRFDAKKLCIPPWSTKNLHGNLPLHEALRAGNINISKTLFDIDNNMLWETNNSGETPIHLFARYGIYDDTKIMKHFEYILARGELAASIRDVEGFTPLLRAVQCGRIKVAWLIAQEYPRSLEICDMKGRTMLHHLRTNANELDEISIRGGEISLADFAQGVNFLRAVRDEDGNTPLHYNLKNDNFATARLLMEICAKSKERTELTLTNNVGQSVFDLLRLKVSELQNDKDGKSIIDLTMSQADLLNMKELMARHWRLKEMDEKFYKSAVEGDATIDKKHYVSQTQDGSNIIHIALRHGTGNFIDQALGEFPELMFQRDYNLDTPLHVAARNYCDPKNERSDAAKKVVEKVKQNKESGFHDGKWTPFVWELKNIHGNTPLHEALRCGNLGLVPILLDCINKNNCADDSKREAWQLEKENVICSTNNAGETVLHIYARYATDQAVKSDRFGNQSISVVNQDQNLKLLLEKSRNAVFIRDRDGLTPLLQAAKSGNFKVAKAIWHEYPQAMQLCDTKKRTFLHLMELSKIDNPYEIFEIKQIDALRVIQDDDGNTPLHLAIKSGQFKKAEILMRRSIDGKDCREFFLANQQCEYINILLEKDDVPNELIKVYQEYDKRYISNYKLRSSYGITSKQIKERADSLSVIAALLATITFAAAFTVPGGLMQDIGIPIFIRKIAFKAFMLLDALAMCGSMLVLYCLVWVMIGTKSESFLLIDMSIILLQGSFVATMLAFAVGVFLTTYREVRWLAILVCVLCGIVTPLLNRTCLSWVTRFLIKYVQPPINKFLIRFVYNPWSNVKRGVLAKNRSQTP